MVPKCSKLGKVEPSIEYFDDTKDLFKELNTQIKPLNFGDLGYKNKPLYAMLR
jgi:hypothetical protein